MRTNHHSRLLPRTPLMRRIEKLYQLDIEQLLETEASNYRLAELLDIDFSTISRWRTKMKEARLAATEEIARRALLTEEK